MQSSKEWQGEIGKPSSAINAKIEENNRMGKTRDLFNKIRDTKGTFHEKMGRRKDKLFTVFVDQDLGTGVDENEGVTGRKARGLQMEEIACKCQTFSSLLSGRRKQTSNIFFLLYTNLKRGFS